MRSLLVWEYRVMRRVHRWYPPRWVRAWMIAASRLGGGWIWWAAAAVILIFGGERRFAALLALGISTLASVALFASVKITAGRTRPCQREPHCWGTLAPPDRFSFPSGHTMAAFALSVTISHYYPVFTPFAAFAAVSIAASRVLLGMHFVSDVLAGALAGAGIGVASCVWAG